MPGVPTFLCHLDISKVSKDIKCKESDLLQLPISSEPSSQSLEPSHTHLRVMQRLLEQVNWSDLHFSRAKKKKTEQSLAYCFQPQLNRKISHTFFLFPRYLGAWKYNTQWRNIGPYMQKHQTKWVLSTSTNPVVVTQNHVDGTRTLCLASNSNQTKMCAVILVTRMAICESSNKTMLLACTCPSNLTFPPPPPPSPLHGQ